MMFFLNKGLCFKKNLNLFFHLFSHNCVLMYVDAITCYQNQVVGCRSGATLYFIPVFLEDLGSKIGSFSLTSQIS